MATRSLGNISLALAIGGLIAIEIGMRQGWLQAGAWQVVLKAFEAATVGGLADWFAVSALFREIPIPLIRRHTNIIVRNRQRIVDGIADMVQNRWLAPAVIREHLETFSASRQLLEFVADPNHLQSVLSVVRGIVRQAAAGMDLPELAAYLERALKQQLAEFSFSKPLGRWFGQRLRAGDHHEVWDALLPLLAKVLRSAEAQTIGRRVVGSAIEAYKSTGLLKRLAADVARALSIVDEEKIVAALLAKAEETLIEAQRRPDHPLRQRIDGALIEFADKLASGDGDAMTLVENLRTLLSEEFDGGRLMQRGLQQLSATLGRELQDAGSDLNRFIERSVDEHLLAFRADPVTQDKFDRWVRRAAVELMAQRHAMIGDIVRNSLEKLSDFDLAGQIEEKVGRDLQYIRLNGAIVGGLAGAVLALIKLWL